MLLNYLKITLKVMSRNKFFTFVSLFGITFTLLILMLLAAFIDHLVAPHYPDVNRHRSLYVGMVQQRNLDEGGMVTGPPSFHFLEKYVSTLETPEKVGIASLPAFYNAFAGGRRLKLNTKFSNAEFWQVTGFDFLAGQPFNERHIDNGDYVAVINEKTRDNYFGARAEAVGKTITVGNTGYRVLGVVRDVPITRPMISADVYLPHTVGAANTQSKSFNGFYVGILLAHSPADFPAIKQEFNSVASRIELPYQTGDFLVQELEVKAETYLEYFLTILFDLKRPAMVFYTFIAIFMLLFMLLPAVNLINLNVSRIMERSSEIGVRKAFGASAGRLVGQFLFENIFITLVGGLIAVLAAMVVIRIFNDSGLIPGADLVLNANVFLAGLAICLVFGLLSGVIPALRMSRLNAVDALHGTDVPRS